MSRGGARAVRTERTHCVSLAAARASRTPTRDRTRVAARDRRLHARAAACDGRRLVPRRPQLAGRPLRAREEPGRPARHQSRALQRRPAALRRAARPASHAIQAGILVH